MIQAILPLFFASIVQTNSNPNFVFPKENEKLMPNENYNIEWNNNNNSNVHLQLEICKNNEWKHSGTNKAHDFLSLVIDKSNTDLRWHVPTLFSDYSPYPSRMKLTHVDTNHIVYSPNFSFLLLTDSPTASPTATPIVNTSEKITDSDFDFLSWWMITIYATVFALVLLLICCKCYCKNSADNARK